MKFASIGWLLASAVCSHAQFEPRIDPVLIDPADTLHSAMSFRDIDGDGDLDLLLLAQEQDLFGNGNSYFLEKLPSGDYSELQHFTFGDVDTFTAAYDINDDGVLDPLQLFVDRSVTINAFTGRPVLRLYPSSSEGLSSWPNNPTEEINFLPFTVLTEGPDHPYLVVLENSEVLDGGAHIELRDARPGTLFNELVASIDVPILARDFARYKIGWGNFDGVGEPDLILPFFSDNGFVVWTRGDSSSDEATVINSGIDSFEYHIMDLDNDGVDDLWSYRDDTLTYAIFNPAERSFSESTEDFTTRGITDSHSLLGSGQEIYGSSPSLFLFSYLDRVGERRLTSVAFNTWVLAEQPADFSQFQPHSQFFGFVSNSNYLLSSGTTENPGITVTGIFRTALDSFDYNIGQIRWSSANTVSIGERLTSFPSFSESKFTTTQIADLSGNGIEDFIHGPDSDGDYWIQKNTRDVIGSLSPLPLLPESYLVNRPALVISQIFPGDVDADGDIDLVINYTDVGDTSVANWQATCLTALNDGEGNFTLPAELPEGFSEGYLSRYCGTIALIDWDKDGDLDLIDGAVGWRENQGNGVFSTQSTFLTSNHAATTDAFGNPVTISVDPFFDDFDGNGTIDLYAPLSRISSLDDAAESGIYSYGTISLTNVQRQITTTIEVPSNIFSVDSFGNPLTLNETVIFDLNLDGLPDLISPQPSTDTFGNSISFTSFYAANEGLPFLYPSFIEGRSPLIFSIPNKVGDFDGDGTKELVSANGFVSATPFGPSFSAGYNFLGMKVLLEPTGQILDIEGDGDSDFLYENDFQNRVRSFTRFVIRNPIVDEESDITFDMLRRGLKGSDANPTSDPDGDGNDNFTELILGSDPTISDAVGSSLLNLTIEDGNQITFFKNKAAVEANIQYQMEESTDLVSWVPIDSNFSEDADLGWEKWETSSANVSPSRYYRLVISPK